jgi:hypothetical protein
LNQGKATKGLDSALIIAVIYKQDPQNTERYNLVLQISTTDHIQKMGKAIGSLTTASIERKLPPAVVTIAGEPATWVDDAMDCRRSSYIGPPLEVERLMPINRHREQPPVGFRVRWSAEDHRW